MDLILFDAWWFIISQRRQGIFFNGTYVALLKSVCLPFSYGNSAVVYREV